MKKVLEKYKGFIIDLDGVVYLDKKPLPHSKKFISKLLTLDKKYVFLTNDSSLSPDEYSKLLSSEDIQCKKGQVINPINNFINLIKIGKIVNKNIMVFASTNLKNYLVKSDINILEKYEDYKKAESIIVSGNIDFSYKDLMYASLCVQNGAKLFATSTDNSYPTKMGNVPATGSIIAAILKTFNTKVINLGKPSKSIFSLALKELGTNKAETIILGDNLVTDIQGARRNGVDSALILTGKTNKRSIKNFIFKPNYVYENLKI